jgi:hypothetical protein
MPIETRIDGNPASIRASADWLRDRLAAEMDRSVGVMFAARDEAGGGWRGDAGPAFGARMDRAGRKSDALRGDVERVAQSFHRYADDLTTAQAGMARARSIARDAGLGLAGDAIQDPGPVPAEVGAYGLAQEEANRARAVLDAAQAIGRSMWDDARTKPLLLVADVVNGAVAGGLAAHHVSILRKQADVFLAESRIAAQRYLTAGGGTPEAMRYNQDAYQRYLDADRYTRRADSVARRVGSRIPIVGLGITAAGIGYDVHRGKPVGKAVISGVGGALAAAGTGAAVGTMVAGPAGTVIGGLVGAGFGLATSGALDYAYDNLPAGTKAAIENGFQAAGDTIGDAGAAIGDGAAKVWNSIF